MIPQCRGSGRLSRRTFLLGNLAVAARASAQATRLGTMTEWLAAPPRAREAELQRCIERISDLDRAIHAWVQISVDKSIGTGPLHGIPFGVKDIIETKGLATEYGSPIYTGRIGTEDAAIVQHLRRLGGVVAGKTHTTSFAYATPAPTRNPRNLAHTPGGSSSGSAAAVAAGMVPFAIGTQTGGSVIRPASFCGVTGFKPSYGLLSMDGVLPFARSFDTLGFFTHTARDMAALWRVMGHSTGGPEDLEAAAIEPIPQVDPPMRAAFADALARLRAASVAIRSVDISPMLVSLRAADRTVMFYEGARFHEQRYKQYGDRLAEMATLVRDGLLIRRERYDDALKFIAECKERMAGIYHSSPVVVTPAAPGPAPQGLASTGDSRLNSPWTALGTPAITIPLPVGTNLPLGLQLTAAHGDDARLLRTAIRFEQALGVAR